MLEAHPIISVYLRGQAGRTPEGSKNHYKAQTSLTLIAHKSRDFEIRDAASSSTKYAPPRRQELENIGVILSAKFPECKTFLAPAMANHLIERSVREPSVVVAISVVGRLRCRRFLY